MNATSIIVIAVAAVVVLGMISFLTLARRSDVRGAGALSAETRQRDRAARAARPVEAPSRNAAEAEAEGVAARTGAALERRPSRHPLAPWVPPDPEAIGVSRRMFFNRATVALMSAGLGAFAAASFVALPLAVPDRRLRRQGRRRQARRHQGGHHRRQRLLLRARSPHLGHRLPEPMRSPRPRRSTPTRSSPACGRASSPCTRSARTSVAACRSASAASGSNARATVRSTTASARRRPAPRRAAWTTSRSRWPATATSPSTPASSSTVQPIGTNTTGQEAEGPHCIGAVGALMPAIATTSIAWVLLAIIVVGWIVYCRAQRGRGAARARLRDRARRQPQAVLRRRGARRSAPRAASSSSACCCS